jgi:DNA-binding beta-propeller fold protein YncE
VLDFVGIFDKLEKALAFDSDEVNAIVKDIGLLKQLFKAKMESKAPEYVALVTRSFNDKDVDNLIEHFRDKDRRKEFFKEYKEIELDLRPTVKGELFSALRQGYLRLAPGTALRAIVGTNPRACYMGFVEAAIPHRIAQIGQSEWEWSATRTSWEPMDNGPGVHHIGISADGRRLYAVDRERTVFLFDAAAQRLIATASVNKGTSHLAVHPRSGHVYVCERSTDSMVRLDADTLQARGRIVTGQSPNLPVAAEDGSVVILPGRNGILTLAYDEEEVRHVNVASAASRALRQSATMAGGRMFPTPCAMYS